MISKLDDYRSKPQPIDRYVPPNAVDAEESVLGSILIDPRSIDRIEFLKPEHFYFSPHQAIFNAALELHQEQNPIDMVSVTQKLASAGNLDKIGGMNRIADLVEIAIGSVNIEFHAQLIVEKFKRRLLIQTFQDLLRSAMDDTDSKTVIAEAEERIFSLSDASQHVGLQHASKFLSAEMDRLTAIADGQAIETGISTGFYDLDAFTKGLKRQKLYIIAGRPGMAKSSLAAAIARNIAGQNIPIAIFSLEMDGGEISRRLLSSESSVDSMLIESGDLSSSEWESVGHSFSRLINLPIHIDESQDVTPSNILSRCRQLKSQSGQLGAVFVDYLHLMLDGSDDEVRELGKITRAFKKMSRALDVPIVVLSQLNRGVESQAIKRPSLASLRGSGAIEQDADLVALLYRDEYYNPETSDRGIAEIIIAKNRGGKTGTAKLLFEPEFTRFKNMAKGGGYEEPPVTRSTPQPITVAAHPIAPDDQWEDV